MIVNDMQTHADQHVLAVFHPSTVILFAQTEHSLLSAYLSISAFANNAKLFV